jgi:2,4-dienoyl-CoA reductase-like NADH-dependent reductase (Old Yellow Enzyme family)
MHAQFPHLFQPLQLRNITLRNRIAISGHHAGWWVDGGRPSDEFAAYIEERARGGVGLFVIGCTSPKSGSGWLENVDDRVIPRYRMMVEAGHRHGVPVFAQLAHPGFEPLPGVPLVQGRPTAPSTQPVYRGPERHSPSIAELHDLVASFGAAAARAAAGGADGLELHSHEWFLHSQMLNPMWNTREDEYGGPLENRMRFMIETLQQMRAAIGPDLVLGCAPQGRRHRAARHGQRRLHRVHPPSGSAQTGRLRHAYGRRRTPAPRPIGAARRRVAAARQKH